MAGWNTQVAMPVPVAQASSEERSMYLAKIYGLLCAGVAAFFGAALLPVVGAAMGIGAAESIVGAAISLPWFVSCLLLFGASWLAHGLARTPVVNLFAFFGFAGFFGFLTIPLVAMCMMKAGGIGILVQSFAITVFAMGGLTTFVFVSKKDFSFIGGFLFMGLAVLIGATIVGAIGQYAFGMDVSLLWMGLSIMSILVFCGYILYDTSMIIHHYTTDMVVAGALALLVDFIILFRNIVFLFLRRD